MNWYFLTIMFWFGYFYKASEDTEHSNKEWFQWMLLSLFAACIWPVILTLSFFNNPEGES